MKQTAEQPFEKELQQLICQTITDQLQELLPVSQVEDDLLTSEQLAELLDIKPQTTGAWRTKGVGPPYIKIVNSVRYRYGDVMDWLKGQTVG